MGLLVEAVPGTFLAMSKTCCTNPLQEHDQVVTQFLLLDAVDDDPCLDKVWYHVSALAFMVTNSWVEGFDCCLRISSEPVAPDREQHFNESAP